MKVLYDKLRETRGLTPELKRAVAELYGSRGERAMELVEKGRVLKLGKEYWILGRRRAYRVSRLKGCGCVNWQRRRPPRVVGDWTRKM